MPDGFLDALLTFAQSDEALMMALRSAESRDEVIALAQARGLRITDDDLVADRELSDAELAWVAGGTMMQTAIYCACLETLPRFC